MGGKISYFLGNSLYWHVGNIEFDELPNGKPHPIIQKMGKPIYTLNYRKSC